MDLRVRGERSEAGEGGDAHPAATPSMMNINLQLSSAIKAQSRVRGGRGSEPRQFAAILFVSLFQTIDFELRKLDAQQASEQINLLKSFMPSSFLISGGESHDSHMTCTLCHVTPHGHHACTTTTRCVSLSP